MMKKILNAVVFLFLGFGLIGVVAATEGESLEPRGDQDRVNSPQHREQGLAVAAERSPDLEKEVEQVGVCRPRDPATSAHERPSPARTWDPATCGRCGDFCSSDNACLGKLLNDPCNNTGGICQAFTGCALFNCCRCV